MPINRELGEVLDRFLDEFLEASHLSSLEQMDRIIVITAIILINLDKPSLGFVFNYVLVKSGVKQ